VINIEKRFENIRKLGDDSFTVKEIAASSDLNASVGKHLDRLGTVTVVIRQRHLIVKRRGFQFPIKPSLVTRTRSFHRIGTNILENASKFLDINMLNKTRHHGYRGNFYP
jgi:hypothetical protein